MERNKSTMEYAIATDKAHGIEVLERTAITRKDEYRFYDIKIADTVIIKDCRVVEGNHGVFISTPSRKDGDKYYPQAYISDAVQTAVLDLIDDDDAWELADTAYLEFSGSKSKSKDSGDSKSNRRRSARR